ncbi:FecR domain-containing protein [Sulfidibacter corallicola]|uniref:FecR domain-containing protein n=1 Tax=Sulfidibacter corallicola TaxID=2818388 RepID=A0A8A4TH24_SULCO|nr:FecR family protein [Sulfidibacter corallicola]QTD48028.1 FecR domain-containing protein [Sulfidibacter corallicola]
MTDPLPDPIEHLLRATMPQQPPPQLTELIRAETHKAWRASVRRRRLQRRLGWAAAIAAALMVALWIRSQALWPAPTSLGHVVKIHGAVTLDHAVLEGAAALRAGQVLRSGDSSGVAIDMEAASLRIGPWTEVTLVGPNRISLDRGLIYCETSSSDADPLVIATAWGEVRHLGTQFMVNVERQTLRIQVREGEVLWHDERIGAGRQVTRHADGRITRSSIQANDPTWSWIGELAIVPDMRGKPVHEFLAWYARETGFRLAYADARTRRNALNHQLRGDFSRFSAREARIVVEKTTNLILRESDDRLEVSSGPAPPPLP